MKTKLPKEVITILNKFTNAGFQIYIVGGAVRDLLLDKEVKDWDFTTDATPEETLKLFPEGFYNNKFGTVGLSILKENDKERAKVDENSQLYEEGETSSESTSHDVHEPGRTGSDLMSESEFENRITPSERQLYEITTMRKEGDYKDHRHPNLVGWTNKIEEDLARRDFTVNAMALKLESRKTNSLTLDSSDLTLIDPFSGQQDLKKKIIKAVGSPDKRFKEDALRLIRAVRIATELEFEIEQKTLESIKQNVHLIKTISWERIRDEFLKILASTNFYIGIIKLRGMGILQIILPELEKGFGMMQEGPKHDRVYDIGQHSLNSLKHCPSSDPILRFACLIHDIGKPDTYKLSPDGNASFYGHDVVGARVAKIICQRFKLSKKQTDKITKLVRWHLFSVDEHQTDSAIRRFIKNVWLENLEDMFILREADRLGGSSNPTSWRTEHFKTRIKKVLEKPFSINDLKINGHDVMEVLNIPPSRKVGEVLQKLFEDVLEDSAKNNREYLLKKMKEFSNKSNSSLLG